MGDKSEEIGKLFVTNNQTFDYLENQKFYRTKEWEYEKRSVSSLLVGSGGGISLTLAFLSAADLPISGGDLRILLILVLFFLTLILTGFCQFALNESASLRYLQFTALNNLQNLETSIQRLDRIETLNKLLNTILPELGIDDEKNSDARFQTVDQINILKRQSIEFEERADKFDVLISKMMISAALLFLFALIIASYLVLEFNL